MDAITPCSFLNQISGLYLQKRIPGITFLGLTYYVEDLAHAVKSLSVTEDRDKAQILGNEVDAKFKHFREEVGKLPELSECILDEQEFKSFSDIRSCPTYCFNTLPNVKYRTGNNVSVVTYDDISGARYAVDALLPKSRTDTFKREWGQAHVDFAALVEDKLELIHNFIDSMQVGSMNKRVVNSDINTQAGNRVNTQAVMNIEPMSTPDERKDATLNTGDTIESRVVSNSDKQMQREAMEAAPGGLPTWAIILIVIVVIAVVAAIVTVVIRKNKKKESVTNSKPAPTPPAVGSSPYAMPSISTGPHAAYYGYGGGMNLYRGRNDMNLYDNINMSTLDMTNPGTSNPDMTDADTYNPNIHGLNQMPSDMAAGVYRK